MLSVHSTIRSFLLTISYVQGTLRKEMLIAAPVTEPFKRTTLGKSDKFI